MDKDDIEDSGRSRRKFHRIPRDSLLVHEVVEFPSPPDPRGEGKVRDLSPTGVRFRCERQYAPGTLLKLDLDLPGWEKNSVEYYRSDPDEALKPLVVLAEVRWSKKAGDGYETGALFVNMDEWHRKALVSFLEKKGWKARNQEN